MNNKISNYLLSALVIILPWHAFLVTLSSKYFLNSNSNYLSNTSLLIASWKEVLILMLGVLFLYKWIKKWEFPIKKIYLFDKLFLIFLTIALSSWILFSDSFIQWLWWFRLDFIYFILFYLIRWIDIKHEDILKIFCKFYISAFLSLIFWLWLYSASFNFLPNKINFEKENYIKLNDQKKEFLQTYYNKKWELVIVNQTLKEFFKHHEQIDFRNENYLNLLTFLWYSDNISSYNPNKPLAAFHFIEARWTARFAWTFSWPNQMWFFLIVLISFIFSLFIQKTKSSFIKWLIKKLRITHESNTFKKWLCTIIDKKFFLFLLIIFWLIALYFTYSRSSWIWFIASVWVFSFLAIPKRARTRTLLLWIISTFLLTILIYNYKWDFIKRTLIRQWSSSVHFEKWLTAIKQVYHNPLWLWLWMAGPTTIRFSKWDEQNIAENWFIQMFQEFWIHWALAYISFMISFLIFLYKNIEKNFLLKWSLISMIWILVAWLFLHSFEDMPTSLILFCFLWLWFKESPTSLSNS